ncbi:helix-turn-helix transcriptional regulator [Chakrabartyella piscis]|uniref:helix-turn-helix domain-containing protein n=1 Tax=Chakrabartyella piscis TaxID=2918914 RepID=UPI00295872EC|nr:helix-turn-helix transcriptional regulator [Chakrabartyella piscis]
MSTLLDRVKELCKAHNITQGELEKRLGISSGASSKWAKSTPNAKLLHDLSDFFQVSSEYLITGQNFSQSNKHQLILDEEAYAVLEELKTRPEMRTLFSVSRNATTEDILKTVKIIEALKGVD